MTRRAQTAGDARSNRQEVAKWKPSALAAQEDLTSRTLEASAASVSSLLIVPEGTLAASKLPFWPS